MLRVGYTGSFCFVYATISVTTTPISEKKNPSTGQPTRFMLLRSAMKKQNQALATETSRPHKKSMLQL